MFSKLYNFWQILKASLWFVPALFCAIYFLFTVGFYLVEVRYLADLNLPDLFFSGSKEDAKSVTLALLSSMITMATLAISITMVVLSLAAAQLGPRLIRTFMSDRKTQDYIGMFFGAVVACFVLAIILHDSGPNTDPPRLTISIIFFLCLFNLFVLLAFVHHVAQSSIADRVILRVTHDLVETLERLTVSESNSDEDQLHRNNEDWPKDFERKKKNLYFQYNGYVQYIDYSHIVTLAEKHDLYVEIHFKAGHFLVEGEDGVRIYPTKEKYTEELEREMRDCFIVGNTRTPTQDIEYSIRHLVEIALRALSPGINDNFTAITVLDRLSSALVILFKKNTLPEFFADNEGKVRLWANQNNESDAIFSAFDQIRHSARDKPDVTFHLLKKISILYDLAQSPRQKDSLKRQLREIEFNLKHLSNLVLNMDIPKALCHELLQRD